MILQALHEYYERADDLAPPGWERKRIPYLIEIGRDGRFVQLTSLRTGTRATDVTASLVPKAEVRAGVRAYAKPNLLWDNKGFVLGHPKSDAPSDIDLAAKQHAHFRQRIEALAARLPDSSGLAALVRFYASGEQRRVAGDPQWPDCQAIPGCNVTFRLAGENDLLVHEPLVRGAVDCGDSSAAEGKGSEAQVACLITGDHDTIQRLHFPISGVAPKPAPLAAINDGTFPSFASHGKHQGENFPVGQRAAFTYATSLNHLLRPDSPQKLRIADATAVFWAQRADAIEDELALLIGAAGDDPDAHVQQVRALYESIRSGAFEGARGDNRFYVLGLAPNAARIAVRFWHAGPLRELALRIRQWFDDLAVARAPHDPPHPTLFALLVATAVQGKTDNVSPHLAGDLMHSLLEGLPLPDTALQAAVHRCRAEQAKKSDTGKPLPNVSYARAALMKACINRLIRAGRLEGKEITVDLDEGSPDAAYLLGRLFAAYERIQSDAAGRDLNRSIRDAYFGSAMSNPASVFPRLVQLNQHHMRDLRRSAPGLHVVRDRLLGEIWGRLAPDYRFPTSQPLAERARFALGYYHQRQAFYAKADGGAEPTQPEGNA
jgi:CRISPR-associated protein Csd1